MTKYNWTIKTLENRYKIICNNLKIEKDPKKLKLLYGDIELLRNIIYEHYNDKDFDDDFTLLEGYDIIKHYMTINKFTWDDIKEFKKLTTYPVFQNNPTVNIINISNNDILELTHDFYKELNPFFYKNFMKNFKMQNNHLVFKKLDLSNPSIYGQTITLDSFDESFIEIYKNNTINDVITSIHEYSHATSARINYHHLLYPKLLFCELDSEFMELLACDYLFKTLNNTDLLKIKINKYDDYRKKAHKIVNHIKLINAEKYLKYGYHNETVLKNISNNKCHIKTNDLKNMLYSPDISSINYLISFIFALELYYLYKEDKEKALYNLEQIILLKCNSEEEYYNNILNFGINPNFNLNKFYQDSINELNLIKKTNHKQ